MKRVMLLAAAGLAAAAALFAGAADAQCPPREKIQQVIARFEAPDRSLVALQPTEFENLCEVQVRLNQRVHIFYTGPSGDFLIMGQLYEAKTGRNLTREKIEQVNLFSAEEMQRLEALTVIRLGEGPFSHLGEQVQHVHGVGVAQAPGRGALRRGMAPVVGVEDEEAPLRQEVGVGGGVGEEAVAARLHVAVEDHHHREGPFALGQVGEAVDPKAFREVGELDPCEAGAFLQDALHPEPPLPVGPLA